MFLYVLLLIVIIWLSYLIVTTACLYRLIRTHARHYTGYVKDIRADEFFRKATILGEIQSFEKNINTEDRIEKAYERSMAIVSDVLLQNGYDPRQYNLRGLVLLHRLQLNLQPIPKGGETNGKSQGPSIQY